MCQQARIGWAAGAIGAALLAFTFASPVMAGDKAWVMTRDGDDEVVTGKFCHAGGVRRLVRVGSRVTCFLGLPGP